jgi:hypothetical protein
MFKIYWKVNFLLSANHRSLFPIAALRRNLLSASLCDLIRQCKRAREITRLNECLRKEEISFSETLLNCESARHAMYCSDSLNDVQSDDNSSERKNVRRNARFIAAMQSG